MPTSLDDRTDPLLTVTHAWDRQQTAINVPDPKPEFDDEDDPEEALVGRPRLYVNINGRRVSTLDWSDDARRSITHGSDRPMAPRDHCRTQVTMELFGKNLKDARLSRGWSQAKLGKKVGLALSSISRYETGASEPGISAYKRISRAFGMSPGELLR